MGEPDYTLHVWVKPCLRPSTRLAKPGGSLRSLGFASSKSTTGAAPWREANVIACLVWSIKVRGVSRLELRASCLPGIERLVRSSVQCTARLIDVLLISSCYDSAHYCEYWLCNMHDVTALWCDPLGEPMRVFANTFKCGKIV